MNTQTQQWKFKKNILPNLNSKSEKVSNIDSQSKSWHNNMDTSTFQIQFRLLLYLCIALCASSVQSDSWTLFKRILL